MLLFSGIERVIGRPLASLEWSTMQNPRAQRWLASFCGDAQAEEKEEQI